MADRDESTTQRGDTDRDTTQRDTSDGASAGRAPRVHETSREGPERPSVEERGYTEREQGDSATTNPTAPASSGRPHGGDGVVDPGHGSDLRPRDSQNPPRQRGGAEPETHEETPVRSPSGGASKGGGSGTGSSAAAAAAAGSDTPARAEGELTKKQKVREDEPEAG